MIVAATRKLAETFAVENNIKDWRYVYDAECIRGLKPFNNKILLHSSWDEKNSTRRIVGLLRMDPFWRIHIDNQITADEVM